MVVDIDFVKKEDIVEVNVEMRIVRQTGTLAGPDQNNDRKIKTIPLQSLL